MALDVITIVTFTVMGTLGGTANVIVWAKSWNDIKQFKSFKSIILGGIVGFLYTFLNTQYNFPNSVMAFVSGYAGKDFIEGIAEKFKKKPEG